MVEVQDAEMKAASEDIRKLNRERLSHKQQIHDDLAANATHESVALMEAVEKSLEKVLLKQRCKIKIQEEITSQSGSTERKTVITIEEVK